MKTSIHVETAKKRISQEVLANKVQVTRQTIHSIERGKKNPSVELEIMIAKVFNVQVEDIFHLESTI